MLKLKFKNQNIYELASKWCLYLAVFLTPLFFLPFTLFPVNLNKQFLLTSLVIIAFIIWLIGGIAKKELIYAKSHLNWLVLVLTIFVAASAFFSRSYHVGFMGMEGNEVDVFINVITFGLLYFLLASSIKKEAELKGLLNCFLLSSLLVLLMSVSQFLGLWFWPWSFAKNVTFNTVGTTNALGVYLGLALVVIITQIYNKVFVSNISKILSSIFGSALFISILLIGYWPIFIGLIVFASILMIVNLKSKKNFKLPLSILALSALFLLINFNFIKIQLPVFNLPAEITPSFQASWNIAKSTIQEGVKNFIFGSGPATFGYQYSLHRDVSLNSTPFWNSRFSQGYNAFLTHLVSWGFVGTIIFKVILLFSLLLIFKLLAKKYLPNQSNIREIEMGLLYLILLLFFYPQNYVLYFSLFLFLGFLVAKESIVENRYQSISLFGSSQRTLSFSLALMSLLVLVVAVLYVNTQRYIGAIYFAYGVGVANEADDIDKALPYLLSGLDLDHKNDLYLQVLSSAFLIKINNILGLDNLPVSDLQVQFSSNIDSALQMARRSTEVNSGNSLNWLALARVYESMILFVSGSAEESFKAYDNAIKLEPNNPALFTGLGRAHLSLADRLTQEKETKEKINTEHGLAIVNFDKALVLKPDFAPAHFSLVQVFDRQNKTEEAIARGERLRAVVLSDNNSDNDVGILFQLGLLHYQAGRFNESKDLLEEAIQLVPDYSNALYFLGSIYDKQGDTKGALELFSRISKLNPDNEEIRQIILNLQDGHSALNDITGKDVRSRKEAPIEEKKSEILSPKSDSE